MILDQLTSVMNRKDLFATPFFLSQIEFNRNQVNYAINNTQCLGAMSLDQDILNTNFKFLLDPINDIVSEVMSELGFKQYDIFSSWMTKTVVGHRHGLDHMHSNSFMSGVLYLTDKASPIIFRHPLPWRWQSKLDDKNDGVLTSNQYVMLPKNGDIILFPSHVHHLIMPHKDPIARCSIAFNVVPTGQYGARDSNINVSIIKKS